MEGQSEWSWRLTQPIPTHLIPSHPSQPAGDKCMSAVCLEAVADTSELLAMSMLVLKWCRCAAVVASKYGPWAHAMRCDVMVGSAAEQVNRPVGWMDGWIVVAAVSHLCCSAESYLNDMHMQCSSVASRCLVAVNWDFDWFSVVCDFAWAWALRLYQQLWASGRLAFYNIFNYRAFFLSTDKHRNGWSCSFSLPLLPLLPLFEFQFEAPKAGRIVADVNCLWSVAILMTKRGGSSLGPTWTLLGSRLPAVCCLPSGRLTIAGRKLMQIRAGAAPWPWPSSDPKVESAILWPWPGSKSEK